jgi:putative transcriptional regulator
MKSINLTDHFLIAMPAMEDPYFSRSLIYIAEHNEQGALGIIVNRPIDMNLATLLEKIDIPLEPSESASLSLLPICFGGPVQTDRGFVLHRPIGAWQSTLTVNENVGLTSSLDVLQAVARDGQPHEIMVTLGYSGWGAGQLEQELAQNAWLTVAADPHILFDTPFEERLPSALERLGIDFTNLSEKAGHA